MEKLDDFGRNTKRKEKDTRTPSLKGRGVFAVSTGDETMDGNPSVYFGQCLGHCRVWGDLHVPLSVSIPKSFNWRRDLDHRNFHHFGHFIPFAQTARYAQNQESQRQLIFV